MAMYPIGSGNGYVPNWCRKWLEASDTELNQHWLIIAAVLWLSPRGNHFLANPRDVKHEMLSKFIRIYLPMMTSSNGNIFRVTCPLWRESTSDRLMICAWTNGGANNRDAGDLRRHRAHYDVTVVQWPMPECLTEAWWRMCASMNRSSLVQVVSWRQFGAKQLSEPMLI